MKIILRTFIFLYFIFLLILINILSISDYEWMIGEGDIDINTLYYITFFRKK